MKKLLAVLLMLMLVLSGCGQETLTPETSETTTAPQESSDETLEDTVTGDPSEDKKALAESCIDKSVEELYALIGQPDSTDYAPSCAGEEGAEDGNLYYDGFIVYTLKQGDSETVVFVE